MRRTATRTDVPFSGATITPNRATEADETLAAVPLRLPLGATADLEASLAHVERALSFRDPDDPGGFTASDTNADSDEGRVVLRWRPRGHRVTLGAELRRDVVSDGSSFGPNLVAEPPHALTVRPGRSTWAGPHAARRCSLGRGGGVGNEVSPRASLSDDPRPHLVSAGQAFRAPARRAVLPVCRQPRARAEHSLSARRACGALSDRLASAAHRKLQPHRGLSADAELPVRRTVRQRSVEASFNQQLGHGGRAR
jgi:hypothetical protein